MKYLLALLFLSSCYNEKKYPFKIEASNRFKAGSKEWKLSAKGLTFPNKNHD